MMHLGNGDMENMIWESYALNLVKIRP